MNAHPRTSRADRLMDMLAMHRTQPQVLTQPQTARFAAFFSQEDGARAALTECLALGEVAATHCRLLGIRHGAAVRLLARPPLRFAKGSGFVAFMLVGGLAGALVGGIAGGLVQLLSDGPLNSRLGSQLALLAWASVCATLGAGFGAWLAGRNEELDHARRFDRTVLRRLRRGDCAVLISGLPEWQMAPLVTLLQQRCERWCHDAGTQVRL